MPSLLVVEGPRKGDRIEVDRALTVGRHGADVEIEDPDLSRRHLEIRMDGDGLVVEDLGSTNGTFVKEREIEGPTAVSDGDLVRCGATVLEVQLVDPGATRLRQVSAEPGATRIRSGVSEPDAAPAAVMPAPPAAAPHAPAPPARVLASSPAGAAGLEAVGTFKPPSVRRGGGLASRSWLPVALSFGTAILVAIALVIYFAQR